MRLWPISLQDSLIKFWPITTHGSAHIFQSSSSDQSQHMVQLTYFQSSCSDQSECMIQLWPIRIHGSDVISWPIRRHGSNSHQHKCLSWSSHQQKYLTFQYKRRAFPPPTSHHAATSSHWQEIPLPTHSLTRTHSPELIPLPIHVSHLTINFYISIFSLSYP